MSWLMDRGRIEFEDPHFRPAEEAPMLEPDDITMGTIATLPEGARLIERAWLVEKMGTQHEGPEWVELGGYGKESWRWTSDRSKAFRCARRSDAEQLASFFGLERFSDVSAVEHAWTD